PAGSSRHGGDAPWTRLLPHVGQEKNQCAAPFPTLIPVVISLRFVFRPAKLGGSNWHARPYSSATTAVEKSTKERARRCACPFPMHGAAQRKPISVIPARPACPDVRPPAAG